MSIVLLLITRLVLLLVFGTWTTPRTWVPGELVTASMMNIHVRDNINSVRSEHFSVQRFRGLTVRTHPDADVAASKVELLHADELVMDDATRMAPVDRLVADITVAGAGGLDTGAEAASTWYEIYAIAKDDATKNLLLHRAKNYSLDQSMTTANGVELLRQGATDRVKLAQGFQTSVTGLVEFVDITMTKVGAPTGRVWFTLETDNAGSPSGTVLATSDKMDVAVMTTTSAPVLRFVFRNPVSLTLTTQYHLVLQGDYTASAVNYVNWSGNTANSYASGVAKKYDGTNWAACATCLDLYFKLYVTQNDVAVTMPSGYTKKAKVGYVYNNSGSNFVQFMANDNSVKRLVAGALGALTSTIMSIVDLSTLVPPVPVTAIVTGFNSVAGNYIAFGGVPDGKSTISQPGDGGQAVINAPVANYYAVIGRFATEFQGCYASVAGGSSTVVLAEWIW